MGLNMFTKYSSFNKLTNERTEFQMVQVFLEIMNSVTMLARRQC